LNEVGFATHTLDRPREHFLTAPPAGTFPARRESLGNLVPMQPLSLFRKRFANVLGQIARGQPRLIEGHGPVGQIPEQLDVHEAMRPRSLDPGARHESTHGEVGV
jgi:hypothetical protein